MNRPGALAAAGAALLLAAMLWVRLPGGLAYPGAEALRGGLAPASPAGQAYLRAMQALFTLDGLFILGWLVSWIGVAEMVRGRRPLPGGLALVLGAGGAVFDLAENSLVWAALRNWEAGLPASAGWIAVWQTVQHLSYWLAFAGAVCAGCGLWSPRPARRLLAGVGTLGVAAAVAGLYLPELAGLADTWYFLWLAGAALLLGRPDAPAPGGAA